MKLKQVMIDCNQLQDYLDKYQEHIKFIIYLSNYSTEYGKGSQFLLVIDEG